MRKSSNHLCLALVAALAGCHGEIGEAAGPGASPQCTGIQPGAAPLRRLTHAEYELTLRDLCGEDQHPASSFPPEEESLGFTNQATSQVVTQLLAEHYMKAAEKIAERAVARLPELLPCDAADGEACGEAFIRTFGRRAWRRPLALDEIARLVELFAWGAAEDGFARGIELTLRALLTSSNFLYRVELGMPDPTAPGSVRLSPHEVAVRLSYLLWSSMPDAELDLAADEGRLTTPEEVGAQARRMLTDWRARDAVGLFAAQWLGLGKVSTLDKDQETYPDFHPGLRPLWRAETLAFVDHVVFFGEGNLEALLGAPYSMMNAELAAFYGVTGPSGADFVPVDLDPARRGGILTHASLLATYAKPNQSSPVHRGKFVRERLLCQVLPPPPNDVAIMPPVVEPGLSTKQRFSQHSDDPACSGCHDLMDPIGFGFEHYDAIGLWRDVDQGVTVESTGEVVAAGDAQGSFDGAVELGQMLADSEEVRRCLTTQWFRWGYGRAESPADDCAVEGADEAFRVSGNDITELLVALTQTDAFLYRTAIEPGGAP